MKIIESVYKEPEKWTVSEYTFNHEGGLKIWKGNGFFFYNTYPESAWSLWMKFKFWCAFRWWSANRPVRSAK